MTSERVYTDRIGTKWSRSVDGFGVRWVMIASGRRYAVSAPHRLLTTPRGRARVAEWIRQTRDVLRDMGLRHG